MPYDDIKSHKKPAFQPLFRRYTFQKTTGGGAQIDSAVLGLKYNLCDYNNVYILVKGHITATTPTPT